MDNNSLLRQLLLMGVGTTTLVVEQLKKAADDLVQSGKMDQDQANDVVNSLLNQVKTEQGNFEGYMHRQIRNILLDLGVPRQAEMDELRGRLDRLERQIRQLENHVYRNR
ncbi:MAG: phasin family protein [Synechococcaceae cyanobacterium SM2_3_1]|nr:phasin family protein [Synechococcaceae cyanobacterium SM2_3_1]